MRLVRGAVVIVELDPTVGHEQRGVRPCIVVSDQDIIGDQRFPLVCVVPITGTQGEGLLYRDSRLEEAASRKCLVTATQFVRMALPDSDW